MATANASSRPQPEEHVIIVDDLLRTMHDWDAAMIRNDADEIGGVMHDDWIITGSDGRVTDRAAFLAVVRSGALTHHEMSSLDPRVRVYGETAVVSSRGVSAGHFEGRAFRERERSSNVFVRQGGAWKCVLTHLSPLPAEAPD